jgi:hypothetical protein
MRRFRVVTAAFVVAACVDRGRELAPIRLEPMTTLGAESGDGAIATSPRVSAHHPGGFRIVIPSAGGVATLPLVYGDNGHFLGTLQAGGSVDEQFRAPLFARIGPGDSVWIFDGGARVFVFAPDRTYVRTAQLPVSPWDALVLPDSRMVIAPANADRPLPLLLLTATGAPIRDIGAGDSASDALLAPRWLVRDNDGSFWSMPLQFRWRLEHWDTTGVLLSAIDRRPEWFLPYTELLPPSRGHPPQPTIAGAWAERGGRLWVLGVAADPHWTLGLGWRRQGSLSEVIVNPDKVFDAVLEVIDPRTGSLVATARMDPSYPSEVEPGIILHVKDTPGGWKQAQLLRVIFDSTLGRLK